MNRFIACLTAPCLLASASSQPNNLIRNDNAEGGPIDWVPAKNVELEVGPERTPAGKLAVKVSWRNVRELRGWAQMGNLLLSRGNVLAAPLKRDTRYRFRCSVLVREFEITPESEEWLAEYPKGMYDPPTVTIGCQGGAWNSGMPFAAYNMGKPRTWQELSFEFTTPFNLGGGFSLHLDTYPSQGARVRMCTSGVMFIGDEMLEECPPRVGFTRTRRPIAVDGSLDDWWETNPVVVTRDQAVVGAPASNRSASGIFYTMWDERRLYIAAKIVDDDFDPARDGIVVRLNGREHVVRAGRAPEGWRVALEPVANVGSTANMYRIVSQFGEEVRGCGGYVAEIAAPISVAGISPEPGAEFELALEILDGAPDGGLRRLRFPNGSSAESATAVLANEKGELRGGEYPVYAVTDAGNPRGALRPLAIKNVATRLLRHGRLGYPRALFRRGKPGKLDAIVSWTTSAVARGVLEFGLDERYGQRVEGTNGVGDASGIAMRVILRDLEPNRQYRCRVVAREGPQAPPLTGRPFLLDTRLPPISGVEHGTIPLTVREPAGIARKAWPVTSGVPLPEGHLRSTDNLRLLGPDGLPVPLQCVPLASWPDGSVRWALLDFQADVPAGGESKYVLEYGNGVHATAAETALLVEEEDERIMVDTGAVSFTIGKTDFQLVEDVRVGGRIVAGPGRLRMTDPEGREFVARRPDTVEIEELGPLRACIRVAGRLVDGSGQPWFGYEVRIHAYAGRPFVRIICTTTCQPKGETRFEFTERIRPEPVSVGSIFMTLNLPKAGDRVRVGTTAAGGSIVSPLAAGAVLEMRQKRESEGWIGDRPFGRLPGWAASGDLLVALRDFWQLYPYAASFRRQGSECGVRIGLLPEIAAAEYPSTPDTVEDWVWGYLRGGAYRLRRGEGRSHELFLTFGQTDTQTIVATARAQLAEPLMARAEPAWYAATRALGNFQPRDERFSEYDKAFERGLNKILVRRESETFFEGRFGLYGKRNFGDHFGSDGMNWDNLEYDFAHCCLTQYMRTGDLRFLRIGRECHLHNRDVDCLTIRPGFERLCAHTGDHNRQLAGLGHTWCEGAWEYYFLTGDRRSAQKALGISNDLAYRIAGLCAQGAPGAGGSRDYGWSVVGLIAAYRATADPLYLNAAREVEEVVVRTQHPFAGGWIKRLSTGHCFHAPAHSGRVYFMQDIVLNGQVLFHQVTGDPDVEACIVTACRGTMSEVRERQARGLPGMGYTSCPFLLTPGPWYPGRKKHSLGVPIRYLAMYYAAGLPGGESLAQELFGMWPESGQLWSGSFSSQGKMFAQGTRWAPRLMHCIVELPGMPNSAAGRRPEDGE
ncbi:MAG: hypothetical protein GXP31_08465 [Kiritimatiellaeota bacterium]|nr:hypothetical protein [Kiritimatiellota bacterium]